MHLDGDLDTVILSELGVPRPVGEYFPLPLPRQKVEILGRPGACDPVWILGFLAVAGAAREINDDRHSEFFGQPHRPLADLLIGFRDGGVGMQWIAMTTQGADRETVD